MGNQAKLKKILII